jgi:glycoprotein endo-alpha-1,2-mannosidase
MKIKRNDKFVNLPLFYIYDSYLIDENQWNLVFNKNSKSKKEIDEKNFFTKNFDFNNFFSFGSGNSIRNTKFDCIAIGLYLNDNDKKKILNSGFDGFYTYFASEGFTEGSNSKNWFYLNDWANQNNLLFIPSVGPGFY